MLLGGGCGVAEHLLESAHQPRVRQPTLDRRDKVIDPEVLRSMCSLSISMRARVDPGMFHTKARRLGLENQVSPVAYVLRRTIRREGHLTLEDRHLLPW